MQPPRRHYYLLNSIFLLSLLLLIVNDHYWKGIYGNGVTGKLSDFAGVLLLPFLLKYLFRGRSNVAVISATVLLFTLWKSPFSQPLIDGINAWGSFSFRRVVDYTDLLAFAVLPLAYYGLGNIGTFTVSFRGDRQWVRWGILPLTLMALIATSDPDYFPQGETTVISDCCLNVPIDERVGSGRIYIPTAFTPDSNGINDIFYVRADTGIAIVDWFEISAIDNRTLYTRTEFAPDDPTFGWDGTADGTIEAGLYRYQFMVTAGDGTTQLFDGWVCSLPCGSPLGLPAPAQIGSCTFSTQFSPIFGFDPTIDSGEVLDCF